MLNSDNVCANCAENSKNSDNKDCEDCAETQYYSKYTHEVILTYTKLLTLKQHKKTMNTYMIKLYRKLYGKHNVDDMTFDYYAVLEWKDKYNNQVHKHWHVLIHLPEDKKHWELNQEFVNQRLKWKHGTMWVREEPMYDSYAYIHDYLMKDKTALHYIGE